MGTEARGTNAIPPTGAPHGTAAAIGEYRRKWWFVRRQRGEKGGAIPSLAALLAVVAFIPSAHAARAAEYLVTSRIESPNGPCLVPTISVRAGADAALGFKDGAEEYLLTVRTGDGSEKTTHSVELRVMEVGKYGKMMSLTAPRVVLDADGVG